MADDCCSSKGQELEALARRVEQRRVLIIVLIINAVMFVAEFGAGIVAGSTALMADASDMLGDALVYGVSIYALSRSDRWKAGAATLIDDHAGVRRDSADCEPLLPSPAQAVPLA